MSTPPREQRAYPPKPTQVYFYSPPSNQRHSLWEHADAIQLLEREDIRVHLPVRQHSQSNGPQPGGPEDQPARELCSQDTASLFCAPWPIVIPSGTYAGVMRHFYSKRSIADPAQHAQFLQFSQRVFEFTEFLVHVVYGQAHYFSRAPSRDHFAPRLSGCLVC